MRSLMGMRIKTDSWASTGIIVIPVGEEWGVAAGGAVGQLPRAKYEVH